MRLLVAAAAAALVAPGVATAAVLRAAVAPTSPAFGDAFSYVVEARGEGVAGLRIDADTSPFVELAAPRIARKGDVLRVVFRLACVEHMCLPLDGPREVVLGPARALVGAVVVARAEEVRVVVRPRVTAAAVRAGRPVYLAPRSLPKLTTTVEPSRLAKILAACALLLVAAAATIALRRRPAPAAADDLERAIRLAREAAGRQPPDRRRAADLLARILRARADGVLARDAVEVAWARPEPSPAGMQALADSAEGGRERV